MSKKNSDPIASPLHALGKLLIFGAFAVPLFFLPTEFPFGAPKAFLIIALACIAIPLLARLWTLDRSYIPRLPKIAWLVGSYAVWLFFTSVVGADFNNSAWSTFSSGEGLITFFAILVLALGLITVLQRKDIRQNLAWAFLASGVLVVLMKYAGGLFSLPLLKGGSTLSNPS